MLHLKYNKFFPCFPCILCFFFFWNFFGFSTAAAIFFHIFIFISGSSSNTLTHTHNVSRNPSASYSWIILPPPNPYYAYCVVLYSSSCLVFFSVKIERWIFFFQQFFRPHLGRINAWLRGFLFQAAVTVAPFLLLDYIAIAVVVVVVVIIKFINIMNYSGSIEAYLLFCVLRHVS